MPPTQDLLQEAGHSTHESEFFNPVPKGYQPGKHKYVVVFGTVLSGLGKGIFSSSLAKLLKDKGLTIAPIKMEGYLNIDSGTLSPYRHGEVFVLDDGLETDMDLGTYERLLDQNLTRDNYTTSGQIFKRVLEKERHGGYLGRDVQMIPHVTGEVKYMLRELAMKQDADVVFIEVGGTVGDHENAFYIEALRQLAFEEGEGSVCYVALTYVIEPPALGEQKTKAAQLGLKKLLEAGVQPNIIAARAKNPVEQGAKEKVAMFSNVPMNRVFSMHDRDSVYTITESLRSEGMDREVLTMLNLHGRVDANHEDQAREEWRSFVRKVVADRKHKVKIGLTGKYAQLRDAYASIEKAVEHCGAHLNAKVEIDWIDTTLMKPDDAAATLKQYNGVIVPGGFGHRGTESKIACVQYCRENNLPYLGICLGFQMAVIDYARNVVGLKDAGSTEFDPNSPDPVIDILPEQKKIEGLGGNMRLGGKDVLIKKDSLAEMLFADEIDKKTSQIRARFRHRFEVDPKYINVLEQHGLVFSGRHPEQPIMQVLELPDHPYFIGGQFHPELTSRPIHPQPMFMGLVAAAIQHANPDLAPEKISTRWLRPQKPKAPASPAAS
ncbi:CTP synthase [Algisphaera agarilytica]|uniref:CTP synthase n=1 Tax=Algisphaera agarilytica TaxID=1385975 RepID=A0A7X0LJT8_9BACT|nr:CTP synthase [Algisphaera agarilytica]MBB6428941.1 CTP synthase [Algisphaera agarilytica]